MGQPALPRLLYLGDVPVESTVAGSALLYRLLEEYPAHRLRIVEGGLNRSSPDHRLVGVRYDVSNFVWKRLLYSRFVFPYSAFLAFTAGARTYQLQATVKDFRPEAIITVAHGFACLTAAALARRLGLPLHLVVHDDWPSAVELPKSLQKWANRRFGAVYRQARSRICVSPYMADEFRKRYGVEGVVIYPSRSARAPSFDQLPARKPVPGAPLVFGYAGSISTPQYAQALVSLASVLKPLDGRLIVFSQVEDDAAGPLALRSSNIELRPIIPFNELMATLRREVDVLFLPMSFSPCHRTNMELSFPSKLTDYTATGLPILIWAPPYSSALRWARENEGVAEVVEEEGVNALERSTRKLARDPDYRDRLGEAARVAGERFFSYSRASSSFYRSLGS